MTAASGAVAIGQGPVSRDPNVLRLQAALFDADRRLARARATKGASDPIVQACTISLQNAQAAAAENSYFLAWDCLHQFNDDMLGALDQAELRAHWASLSSEADDKLKGWRAKAAEALKKSVTAGQPVPLEVVREVQMQLAATSQNQQHKIDVYARKTLPSLAFFLLLVVGATLFFCYSVINATTPSAKLLPWAQSIFIGLIAGLLGGVLSMTFSLGRVDLSKKIPDMRLGALATSIRPLLGAAVAIPVVVFVEANYVEVKGFEKPLSILAFCFLAGFSERWFLGLVEKFEAGKK